MCCKCVVNPSVGQIWAVAVSLGLTYAVFHWTADLVVSVTAKRSNGNQCSLFICVILLSLVLLYTPIILFMHISAELNISAMSGYSCIILLKIVAWH